MATTPILLRDADPAPHAIAAPALPANVEAEAAFLGAVLIDNRILEDMPCPLTQDHFFAAVHGRVFARISTLIDRKAVVTPVTLKPYFETDDGLKELGGTAYLARLTADGAGMQANIAQPPGIQVWNGTLLRTDFSLDAAALVSNWAGGNPITVTLASPAGPETVPSGTQVSFSGSAVDTGGGTLSYQWSFGDGSVVVPTATATHQYLDAGTTAKTYLATFTASDGVNSQSGTLAITVTPTVNLAITLPVANVGVLPGVPVVFNGTGTTLNSGSPLVYSWSFGDGSPAATGANVTHTFPENAAAPFAVTLTAADATGAVGTAAISVISDTATVMDVNRDGAADVRDLLVLAGAWNPSLQATPTAFGGLDFAADLNGDGRVDDTDLDLWISHFVPGAP